MTPSTIQKITVIEARSSEGPMYCVSAKTKAARAVLVGLLGKPCSSGYHILTVPEAVALRDRLRTEVAA